MAEEKNTNSPLAIGSRPSPLGPPTIGRSALLSLLRTDFPAGFGIHRSIWTLDTALKSITLEQVAAIVSHAWDQQIDGVLPWKAGAVVMRLTDPDLVQLPPGEGWAAPNPDWVKLEGRRQRDAAAMREQLAKRQEQQRAEEKRTADLAARKQLELDFGPLVDQVEQSAPERLWSILRAKNVERVVRSSPEGFRGKIARLLLLRAAEAGEL